MGRNDLHAVEGLLTQALGHMLNLQAWPNAPAAPGWKSGTGITSPGATPVCTVHDAAHRSGRALCGCAGPDAGDDRRAPPGQPCLDRCPVTLTEILADE